MELYVVTSTTYETYNEFHGVFSTRELAEKKIGELPNYLYADAAIHVVELDDMNWSD